MILSVLAYVATASVMVTYLVLALRPSEKAEHLFHVANALGSLPLAVVGVLAGAYQPAALSVFFGIAGSIGWYRTRGALRWKASTPTA